MSNIFKQILFFIAPLLFFSCSNDFIKESLNIDGVSNTPLIVSPEWEPGEYQVRCKGAGNADFIVENIPGWMDLETTDGKFENEIATIRCSATFKPDFSKTGIYIEQIILSTDAGKYAVPVYYISEGDPVIQVPQEIDLAALHSGNGQLKITNTGDGILLWRLVSIPEWTTYIDDFYAPPAAFLTKGFSTELLFSFDADKAVENNFTGKIVLASNDKNHSLVEINVYVDLGTPVLNTYYLEPPVIFNTNVNSQLLEISNIGNGILIWNINELPDWLTVSESKGTINSFTSKNLEVTCDYSKLKPGLNIDTFFVKTNDVTNPLFPVIVKARMPGNSESIRSVNGNIIDVAFNKQTNTLYYATSQPNQLVIYDVTTRSVTREIELNKAPNCLSVSEDFSKAAVGHGGFISAIDLKSNTVSAIFEFDYSIYDIEWAKDDWFCYTQNNSTISNLFWINTKTSETYETISSDYRIGTGNLKKVPNQPFIIASAKEISPSGIYVFDIETKTKKSYTHTSIENVWFFGEGNFTIDSYSKVYKTSTLTSASGNSIYSPAVVGEIKTGEYSVPAWWVDYSPVAHSIWAIFSYYPYMYYPPVPATIYQFEDNDYSLINTYYYDNIYQPDAQTPAFEVEARYVFANNEGTELIVLRKGKENSNWTIEYIQIQ